MISEINILKYKIVYLLQSAKINNKEINQLGIN